MRSPKGERSRARLIAATGELLQRQGYHATGLADIVSASEAPRGSLYFYFPGGKEELACVALREAGEAWRARIEAEIAGAPDLAAAVGAVCQLLARELEASDFKLGCPLATVALEAAADSDRVRRTCEEHFRGWEDSIAARLIAAGAEPTRAREMATFTLSALEGALLLCKVKRDTSPLRDTGRMLAALVAMAS